MNMSQVQRQSGLTAGMVRRYWYSTQDGKVNGEPLTEVSLKALEVLADLLKVRPTDLLTDVPKSAVDKENVPANGASPNSN